MIQVDVSISCPSNHTFTGGIRWVESTAPIKDDQGVGTVLTLRLTAVGKPGSRAGAREWPGGEFGFPFKLVLKDEEPSS